MRNIDYPYDHQRFYRIWEQFRHQHQRPRPQASQLDPIIATSWQRCVSLFDHKKITTTRRRAMPDEVPNRDDDLISVAIPYLEDIHQFIEGAASAVILTDGEGFVLAIEGSLPTFDTLHKIGMNVGECWAEDYIGTNAIGLSLITAMPTQVVGAEHYLQIFHDYGDSAAPIHDEQGKIIGTIAILTFADKTNQSQLALVMATARAISNQIQANLNLEQANHRLRQLDSILESVTEGVMTWNMAGQVEHVNSMACQMLGIHASWLLGNPLNDFMLFPAHIQTAIREHREIIDAETRIQIDNRILQCLITVRPIYNGAQAIIGGVAMFRSLSQVRSLVNQQTSGSPSVTFDDFLYHSSHIHAVLRQARTAAKGSAAVLLMGEVGVGKTILAQAIHNASPRSPKPFVVVNCGMIPAEYMVEELLGREAKPDQVGRPSKFELADGGTLLFDMIDQLSLQAQHILLNIMNSRHVYRLHASRPTAVNVRIIATTSENLEVLINNNGFLPQLYYLFNAFRLYIPPLRERREDIVRLALGFLDRLQASEDRLAFGQDVLDLLTNYPWPGNVRELESIIERAIMNAVGHQIQLEDLPENIRTEQSLGPGTQVPQPAVSLEIAEREAIIAAGWACQGVISDMADLLEINRSTLWRKLKQHRISAKDFKQKSNGISSS